MCLTVEAEFKDHSSEDFCCQDIVTQLNIATMGKCKPSGMMGGNWSNEWGLLIGRGETGRFIFEAGLAIFPNFTITAHESQSDTDWIK